VIELYTYATPNGRKVSIALEELALEYQVHSVNIQNKEQLSESFLKLSPNNKIPAIVDTDTDISLMESGAILLYLAEKTGQLIPQDERRRWQCMEWLMWQMGGVGPMLGQVHHFSKFNSGVAPYAEQRYVDEARRLYRVLNKQLRSRAFIVGEYSLADIAVWPWISRFEWQQIDLNNYPEVKRWYLNIAQRPAVIAGYDVPGLNEKIPLP
jgi:GSH-dependent disulfide-bond oxidoreductase